LANEKGYLAKGLFGFRGPLHAGMSFFE
jgi:hypothetical protein